MGNLDQDDKRRKLCTDSPQMIACTSQSWGFFGQLDCSRTRNSIGKHSVCTQFLYSHKSGFIHTLAFIFSSRDSGSNSLGVNTLPFSCPSTQLLAEQAVAQRSRSFHPPSHWLVNHLTKQDRLLHSSH